METRVLRDNSTCAWNRTSSSSSEDCFTVFQHFGGSSHVVPLISLTASSDKKVPKHNPTLSNLLLTLLSQPCLWSSCSSHHRDQQQHGQLPFGTSALDEPYRHCRALSKMLLWRRALKGGLSASLADRAQLLRVACFEAGGLGNTHLNPCLLYMLAFIQDAQDDFVMN